MSLENNDSTPPPAPGVPMPPPGAPAVPAEKKGNVLGLLSVILAVVGFLVAIIPLLGVVGWPLLIAALVLGIIGMTRKGHPKGTSVAGLALSVLAMILAPILALSIFVGSVDEANKSTVDTGVARQDEPANDGEKPAGDEKPAAGEEDASGAGTTRDDPAPIGSKITGPEWEVVVNSVTLGADKQVAAANTFNSAPPEGSEYILINVTVTYIGDDKAMPAMVSVGYVTPDGKTIDGLQDIAVAPDALDSMSELYNGASATGNIALAVPSATAADGVLVISPGLLADDVFVAVE